MNVVGSEMSVVERKESSVPGVCFWVGLKAGLCHIMYSILDRLSLICLRDR